MSSAVASRGLGRNSPFGSDTASDGQHECVEIATNIPTTIAIRDSKNPTVPSLLLQPPTWTHFHTALLSSAGIGGA
ncbi:DUF397 domain-containing protein [Streptomyces sp. SD15]